MNKKIVPYEDFVNKFKPKRTTDDCYTPPKVYDAVLEWARQYLGIGSRTVVRPFFPDCVLRATNLHTMTRAGILYQVDRQEARVVSQACRNGNEFGNSVLLSSRATAEKLAAEKLAAEKLVLSDKSLAILEELNSHY